MSIKPHAYLIGDGSSSKGDDIGAWASVAVMANQSQRKLLYAVDFPTTISRVELRPIIEGLRWIKHNWAHGTPGFRVRVYSDSQYTIRTCAGEYPRKKNEDLWAALDEAKRGLQVEFVWRERNSTPYGTFCDGLCGSLRKNMIETMSRASADPRKPEESMPKFALPEEPNENLPT